MLVLINISGWLREYVVQEVLTKNNTGNRLNIVSDVNDIPEDGELLQLFISYEKLTIPHRFALRNTHTNIFLQVIDRSIPGRSVRL